MLIFVCITFLIFSLYAALIFYYKSAWNEIPEKDSGQPVALTTEIAVVVPVRNEENNILSLLDALSQQTYPKHLYRVVVVDDHSTDNTWQLASNWFHEKMNLTCLKLDDATADLKTRSYKKLAIETGIGRVTEELIVTTDADCRPETDWLKTIAVFYQHTQAQFIAAPVKINVGKSLVSIFQALDFITLQGITGASVYKRVHSMCNGANLAYTKEAFNTVNGFRGIDNIPSGDDMLLMHKIYKKYPDKIFYLKNKCAIVTTAPEASWKSLIHQRIRWASKSDQYDDKRIFWVLLLVYTINFLFVAIFVLCFANKFFIALLVSLLLMKTFIEYPFVKSAAAFFGQESQMMYFPLMQPLHILYTVVIGFLGKFGSYEWKGRKVNPKH